MKTLREEIKAAYKELWGDDLTERDFEVIQSCLTPPVDAAAQRKAEVARIAEKRYLDSLNDFRGTLDDCLKESFRFSEAFVAYKESLK